MRCPINNWPRLSRMDGKGKYRLKITWFDFKRMQKQKQVFLSLGTKPRGLGGTLLATNVSQLLMHQAG